MQSFQVDPTRLIPSNPSKVAELCWMAREILGGYMEYVDDEPLEEAGEEGTSPADPSHDGETVEPQVYQTPPVPINNIQKVTLDNLPLTIGADDKLYPLYEPGYVALCADVIIPDEDDPVADVRHADFPQLVFQMPRPGEPGAIFEGYELTDRFKIMDGQTRRLSQVQLLLECVRIGLQNMAEEDPDTYEGMHHSQAPVPSVMTTMDAELSKLLGT